MAWLALQTIKVRRANRVKLGDGGNFALQSAIRAQGNFAEYMPIVLILLFLLEYNGMYSLVIHAVGMAFLAGRWIHAQGLLKDNLRYRMRGMDFTLAILIGLAVANILLAAFQLLKS
jgi:uncharacterized membrane protein YecN with MAPEG domain